MLRLSLIVLIAFFVSCDNNDAVPRGKYATGVFVVNEGNFNEADGSIDFLSSTNERSAGIYGSENDVTTSGVFQSLYFNQDRAYLIDQVGNRVTVVKAETFKHIEFWENDMSTPRYITVANNKAYISNWGPFDQNFDLPNSFVLVIDLESGETLKKITTDKGSEGIISFGGNVYVANSYSNTIQVINTDSDEVDSSFEVAFAPTSFAEDKNGKFWVLSSHWLEGAHLSLVDLAMEQVFKSFPVAGSSKSLNINGAGDKVYYLSTPFGSDASVYMVDIDATEAPSEPVLSAANLYGLGVDPSNGELYLANHNGFQGNGSIVRTNSAGEEQESYSAGRAPNGFVFRK